MGNQGGVFDWGKKQQLLQGRKKKPKQKPKQVKMPCTVPRILSQKKKEGGGIEKKEISSLTKAGEGGCLVVS